MEEKQFQSLEEFFSAIDKTGFLVLRNFDDITEDRLDTPEDIDVLCESRDEFIRLSGARLCRNDENCNNYYVLIRGKKLRVDIRDIGDGYYDAAWEKDMLAKRVKKGSFYIMEEQDYLHALLYHAVIQKPAFSDKYFSILKGPLGLKSKKPFHCCRVLAKYMKKRGYKLAQPKDPFVAMNKKNCRRFSFAYFFA